MAKSKFKVGDVVVCSDSEACSPQFAEWYRHCEYNLMVTRVSDIDIIISGRSISGGKHVYYTLTKTLAEQWLSIVVSHDNGESPNVCDSAPYPASRHLAAVGIFLDEIKALLCRKSEAYGGFGSQTNPITGDEGQTMNLIRLGDKVNRVRQCYRDGLADKQALHEALVDVIWYATIVAVSNRWGGP